MNIIEIIERKRDGKELTCEELAFFVRAYTEDEIPDYQAAAFLMAFYLRGASWKETFYLTESMVKSGQLMDLSSLPGLKIDKHSTGGVGDKLSLTALPLAAAAGLPIAKMSGRGLGHTGGTLDKLESVPGMNIALTESEMIKQVGEIGLCINGQTKELVPADGKLYALRDVTATISSVPLIAASIMSKKIASGTDKILLDITVGNGAFMGTLAQGVELAQLMVQIGQNFGRETKAIVTNMDQPLGNAIGNYLELREAFSCLEGNGPEDLRQLTLHFAARMVQMAGNSKSMSEIIPELTQLIENGQALKRLHLMLEKQGGQIDSLDQKDYLEDVEQILVLAEKDGFVKTIETKSLGLFVVSLNGGRMTKDAPIDHAVGLELQVKKGMYVQRGQPLLRVYCRKNQREWVEERKHILQKHFVLNALEERSEDLILKEIGFEEVQG